MMPAFGRGDKLEDTVFPRYTEVLNVTLAASMIRVESGTAINSAQELTDVSQICLHD